MLPSGNSPQYLSTTASMPMDIMSGKNRCDRLLNVLFRLGQMSYFGNTHTRGCDIRLPLEVLDCNSGMSRSRQTLAGSRIADFTLKLIWASEQPTMCPTRKLPRYATFRQIKGPR